MENRVIIKREELKEHRRKYMTVRKMSIYSDLSISTINNIEDSSKQINTASLFKYLNVLLTVLEDNSVKGPFYFNYTYDKVKYSLGFSRDNSNESENENEK